MRSPPPAPRRAARFVAEHVAPHLEGWERDRHFPRELIPLLASEGFFRKDLGDDARGDDPRPETLGSDAALIEALGAALAAGVSISVLAHMTMALPLLVRLADSPGTRRWVERARSGDALLGLAATEAVSGSDMNAIETVARVDGEDVVVDGVKRYITNGSAADALVVLARLQDRRPPWASVLVLVPTASPGVARTRLEPAGLRSGDLAEVSFAGCRLTRDHLLGEPGRGFFYLMAGLQRERLLGALGVNAMAGEVLRRTLAFVRGRVRMAEPLVRKQAIRHRLAELEARLEASRAFARQVADGFERGQPVDREIWMLKVFCYATAQEVIGACAHLHGAEAFLEGHWMGRALRDAQAFGLAAGTSEVMKELLAAHYDVGPGAGEG